MAKLEEIEGIGPVFGMKLRNAGVKSTEALLRQAATPQGRKMLAKQAEVDHDLILRWVNHCDLARIKGVGNEYSDLLEAAGVDTVPELATRKPENLHKKLAEVNLEKEKVRQLPSLRQVESWVEQAKCLTRVIEY